jgi:hypothetical protein
MRKTIALAAMLLPVLAFGRGRVLVESHDVAAGPGVISADMLTNLGHVYTNLPIDLMPGERISGSIAAIPRGATDAARSSNAAALGALDVEICGSTYPVRGGAFTCPEVPVDSIEVILKDGSEPLFQLPVTVPKSAPRPSPSAFVLPAEGLSGGRARAVGPFGKTTETVTVSVAGSPAHVVAQSPRASIFDVPPGPGGMTTIELHAGDIVLRGDFRIVSLRIAPPRPIIHTGERTAFAAQVFGLKGLRKTLTLKLTNLSPAIVSMEGGNAQDVTIVPAEVSAAGTYDISRRLTGIHRGDYVINVFLPWKEEQFERAP